MKKIDIKSMLLGMLIGTITLSSATASTIGIKSAKFNNVKVLYNGEELKLSQPLITVIRDNSQYGSNYIPVRGILEELGYKVDWENSTQSVIISDDITLEDKEGVSEISVEYVNLKTINDFMSLYNILIRSRNDTYIILCEYKNIESKIDIEEFVSYFKNNELEIYNYLTKDLDKNIFNIRIGYIGDKENVFEEVYYHRDSNEIIRSTDMITSWSYSPDLYK